MPINPLTLPVWYAQYVIEYEGPGQSGHVNSIGVIGSTDGSTAINQGDCDNFAEAWRDHFASQMNENVTMLSVKLRNSTSEFNNVTTKDGDFSGNMMPLNNAYHYRKVVATEGSPPGALYLPGVTENNIENNGQLVGSVLTQLQDHADDFLTEIASHDLRMLVGHNVPALVLSEVTQIIADPLVSNQRRRIRR